MKINPEQCRNTIIAKYGSQKKCSELAKIKENETRLRKYGTMSSNCNKTDDELAAIQIRSFYNGELVAVMTFGKSRFNDEFELLHFANKNNINVVGGASKLFKHFLAGHSEVTEIITYADRRWSQGNVYERLGFSLLSVMPPNYYYILSDGRHNRIEFQKHKLVAEDYYKNKTQHDFMLKRKIYRIYDCVVILSISM